MKFEDYDNFGVNLNCTSFKDFENENLKKEQRLFPIDCMF